MLAPRRWIGSGARAVRGAPRGLWTCGRLSRPRPSSSSPSSLASAPPPHLFDRVLGHAQRPALYEAGAAAPWTYAQLLREAVDLSQRIQQALPASAQGGQPRVAYLGARGAPYVAIQWATWLAGGVAVPLHPAHPTEELQYILDDSDASVLIVSDEFTDAATHASLDALLRGVRASGKLALLPYARPTQRGAPVHDDDDAGGAQHTVAKWLHGLDGGERGAHIVYTSGTTGRPKGVVTTHAGLTAQIADVVHAWEMTERDHLLHFLPLHHVHGILNNLLCVHYAGGSLEFIASAKPALVWQKLLEGLAAGDDSSDSASTRAVTMLMAVPTVYMNLLEEMERCASRADADADAAGFDAQAAVEAARRLRVAISGSMACPVSILNRWEALTGLRLLERYGMTELGMALTNPLHGERHLGYVGQPFPSVRVRLVDPDTERALPLASELEGELRVKGPTVFKEYWRKPEATAQEFDADGWFKTGDIAQYDVAKASFRIRGRASADIIKSGGYKVSALDVERVLLSHARVLECAVFGLPDEKWGQVVAAALRVDAVRDADADADETLDGSAGRALAPQLQAFCREHLADYRVPRKLFVVGEIPKNAMGKVNKKALAALFATAPAPCD